MGIQKFGAVPGYAHAPFSPKLYVPDKFEFHSFTRSWDNSDSSFGWGLRTPDLIRKRRP